MDEPLQWTTVQKKTPCPCNILVTLVTEKSKTREMPPLDIVNHLHISFLKYESSASLTSFQAMEDV